MSNGKSDISEIFEGVSKVVLRAIPGLGTLGSSVLAKFIPWFGWLAYVGFSDSLNTPIIGTLTPDEYRALASEAVRQSIVALLRSPLSFALALLFLFVATVHVGVKPPEKHPDKPDRKKPDRPDRTNPNKVDRTNPGIPPRLMRFKEDLKHLEFGSYYFRYYYPITTIVFLCLFALLVVWASRWIAVTVLLTCAIAIPLFSFRHGYESKDNWQAVTYVVLLLVLVLVMVAYPYRFGKSAYSPAFVWLVPEVTQELSALRMRIEPPAPGFNLSLSCQRGKWLIELGDAGNIKVVRKESYGSLTELPWTCEGGHMTPIEYAPPP